MRIAVSRGSTKTPGSADRASELQGKPLVGAPADPLEYEADAVAEKVMRMEEPASLGSARAAIQLQHEPAPSAPTDAAMNTEAAVRAAGSTGSPLPRAVRAFFEPRLRHDLSQVRVHADDAAADAARAVQARAYTLGQDIVFGRGEYAPGTAEGKRLLAHELTHTVQQRGGAPSVLRRKPTGTGGQKYTQGQLVVAQTGFALMDQLGGTPGQKKLKTVKKGDLLRIETEPKYGAGVAYYATAMVSPTLEEQDATGQPLVGVVNISWIAPAPAAQAPEATPRAGMGDVHAAEAKAQEPEAPLLPAANTFSGIELYFKVKVVPHSDFVDPKRILRKPPYLIVPQLCRESSGPPTVAYYVAYRNEPGLIGPTGWIEYVIGPDSIDTFLGNLKAYTGGASMAYMFGPPSPSSVEGAAFTQNLLQGQFGEAFSAYGRAWTEALTDPGWWMQMATASAGLVSRVPRPVPPSGGVPWTPRVIPGGGMRVPAPAVAPARAFPVVGANALQPVAAAPVAAAPAPALRLLPPLAPAPSPIPMAPLYPLGALASVAGGSATNAQTGSQPVPATAPAPQQTQQRSGPGASKVADSNIFMDRVEGGPAQRLRIDTTILTNPSLTLHVPQTAIQEATQVDPKGTQRARLAGIPGGAKIVPDRDGDVSKIDLSKVTSSKFNEADVRIALRAVERGEPLLSTNSKMSTQVRDGHYPDRVALFASLIIEHP